jgi:2-polyprenyl-3-methyl-5-hydroxy-6-metoxy-1,4-benzoquinol methylase
MAGLDGLAGYLVRVLRRFPAVAGTFGLSPRDDILGPPVVTWPGKPRTRSATCPNCASAVAKPLVLTIVFTTLPGWRRKLLLLRCPACTCLFYSLRVTPDYAEEAMLERGRVPFYLQQGAGLSLITRPLAQLRRPAGSVYVEVGCGFGFGLDYACRAKGWTGRGIDPAGLAAMGEEMLGVSIERRYLGQTEPDLAGRCDVVMASETIEHVPSPAAFVGVLRGLLRSGGTLILTTPNAAELRPEISPSVLVPLLSPGLHLIFQTAESLRALLVDAGFRHVVLDQDGHSLVAFASDQPLELERDEAVLRAEFRAYLERRADDFAPHHDLFLAFAGRALQEAVNDGAFDQARRVRAGLDQACAARFGRSLEALGLQSMAMEATPLETLALDMPLNLGGLLYADAILRLAAGEPRAGLAGRFRQAAAGARLLRQALADLAMDDGMSQDIAWTAQAEALLCAAAAGADDLQAQLAALPPAPDKQHSATRRQDIVLRALAELVNAGHYERAAELCEATGLNAAAWSDPKVDAPRSDAERDALFCLAVLDATRDEPKLIERSRGRFHRLRLLLGRADGPGVPDGLFQAALQGEADALDRLGRPDDADRLRMAPIDASRNPPP